MGLPQNPGFAHLVFLNAQDPAQCIHLPAHVLHHLMDGIDLHFAVLEAVQGKADGHVLGGLHKKRSFALIRCFVGGQVCQQLLQIDFGVGVDCTQFSLQKIGRHTGITPNLAKLGEQADGL